MTTQEQDERAEPQGWARRWGPLLGLLLVAVLLAAATAASPKLGKQGGEWFGRLIRAVQRHPGITSALVLGSVAGVWLTIGVGVAVQARQAKRDGAP